MAKIFYHLYTYSMNKTNFKSRLERYKLTESQQKKCLNVYDRIAAARAVAVDELEQLRSKIHFAGFFDNNQKLRLSDREIRRKNATIGFVSCSDTQNLLELKHKNVASPAPTMKPVGTITVYEPAEPDEKPHLTIPDVLAQIPQNLSETARAFCLRLEDKFLINGYNLLTRTYEYNVELYA